MTQEQLFTAGPVRIYRRSSAPRTGVRMPRGVRHRRLNVPREELRKLYEDDGLTQYEIAAIYGVSQTCVAKTLHRLKIPMRATRSWTPEEIGTLLWDDRKTISEVAEIFGVSRSSIASACAQHG